jgi:hypothetical protein
MHHNVHIKFVTVDVFFYYFLVKKILLGLIILLDLIEQPNSRALSFPFLIPKVVELCSVTRPNTFRFGFSTKSNGLQIKKEMKRF